LPFFEMFVCKLLLFVRKTDEVRFYFKSWKFFGVGFACCKQIVSLQPNLVEKQNPPMIIDGFS